MASAWHQYAYDAVAAGRAENEVQEKLRPIVLRIAKLKKEQAEFEKAQQRAPGSAALDEESTAKDRSRDFICILYNV